MAPKLIACPACECHAKSSETTCPHCGAVLRREDSRIPRSATALALGLSAVLTASGCEPEAIPVYGVPPTTGAGGIGGMGGQGGEGGTAGQGGAAGQGGTAGAAGQGGQGGMGGGGGGMGGQGGM